MIAMDMSVITLSLSLLEEWEGLFHSHFPMWMTGRRKRVKEERNRSKGKPKSNLLVFLRSC